MILWVDVETTGLLPSHRLIELGMILTTPNLTEVDSFRSVIRPWDWRQSRKFADPVCVDMHMHSGLWEEVENAGLIHDSAYVSQEAHTWIVSHGATGLPMAGSSVHFDRAVLLREMPAVHDLFGYRNIDVTTIKELIRMWGGNDKAWSIAGAKKHRVLDDLRASIEELQFYRERFFDV